MQRDQIELELRTLIDEVVSGHERLLAGEEFGLQGISQRIDTACQAALSLPNDEVVMLQPVMAELRNRLQEFSDLMNTAMARAAEEDGTAGPAGGDAPSAGEQ